MVLGGEKWGTPNARNSLFGAFRCQILRHSLAVLLKYTSFGTRIFLEMHSNK
jgi:hypothetical protein